MNDIPQRSQQVHSAFTNLPNLSDQEDQIGAVIHCQFEKLKGETVARLAPDQDPPGEGSGSFSLEGKLVIMRLNPENDQIEIFVDVGVPHAHSREEVYRALLEMNLSRTYPGVVFGIHAESRRAVLTSSAHVFMVTDADACISWISSLVDIAKQMTLRCEIEIS